MEAAKTDFFSGLVLSSNTDNDLRNTEAIHYACEIKRATQPGLPPMVNYSGSAAFRLSFGERLHCAPKSTVGYDWLGEPRLETSTERAG